MNSPLVWTSEPPLSNLLTGRNVESILEQVKTGTDTNWSLVVDLDKIADLDRDAPVEEVLIGYQFDKTTSLNPLHLGRYWERISSEFPLAREPKAAIRVAFNEPLELDTQLLSQDKSWILQLKRHAITLSWVRQDSPTYPGFGRVRERFLSIFESYTGYLDKLGARPPRIQGAHVSYVNHLPLTNSTSRTPLADIFPNLSWELSQALPPPPSLDVKADFPFPKGDGMLSVKIKYPVFRSGKKGLEPAVLFQLLGLAEVKPDVPHDDVSEWFDHARHFINLAFNDLLSDNAISQYCRKKGSEDRDNDCT